MNQTDAAIIRTEGLGKTYDGNVTALKSLDLSVPKNSIFGFLGPNGAGKTTAMKLLLGLARPTSGCGTVFGLDTVSDSAEIRSRIGYLPQQPTFPEYMTAREVLDFTAGFFFRGSKVEVEARIEEMLELVGLQEKAGRLVGRLSGGERQRLGIAQAQVHAPDLLILNELAASLDPIGRHDVLDIIVHLRERATVFYSTHILDDVQRISDTVAILRDGESVAQGPVEELLAGQGDPVYAVTMRGDPGDVHDRVISQPWVSGIDVTNSGETTTWEVAVTDTRAAESQLLRLVLCNSQSAPELAVIRFGQRRFELEEVFMELVGGGKDG